jgi:hypothetical protein
MRCVAQHDTRVIVILNEVTNLFRSKSDLGKPDER